MTFHIALYKFKPGVGNDEINNVLSEVEALKDKISGVLDINTGVNTSIYSEGYTYVILVTAQNSTAIDEYRSHPDHVVVAEKLSKMEDRGIGVDFETEA